MPSSVRIRLTKGDMNFVERKEHNIYVEGRQRKLYEDLNSVRLSNRQGSQIDRDHET
jgi:hypothetical protein